MFLFPPPFRVKGQGGGSTDYEQSLRNQVLAAEFYLDSIRASLSRLRLAHPFQNCAGNTGSSTWPIRPDRGSATERHKTQKSLTSEFLFDAPWQCCQQLQGAHPICQQNPSIAKQPPGLAGQFLLLGHVSGMHFSHRL